MVTDQNGSSPITQSWFFCRPDGDGPQAGALHAQHQQPAQQPAVIAAVVSHQIPQQHRRQRQLQRRLCRHGDEPPEHPPPGTGGLCPLPPHQRDPETGLRRQHCQHRQSAQRQLGTDRRQAGPAVQHHPLDPKAAFDLGGHVKPDAGNMMPVHSAGNRRRDRPIFQGGGHILIAGRNEKLRHLPLRLHAGDIHRNLSQTDLFAQIKQNPGIAAPGGQAALLIQGKILQVLLFRPIQLLRKDDSLGVALHHDPCGSSRRRQKQHGQ